MIYEVTHLTCEVSVVGFNPFNAGYVFDRLVWIIENEKRNQPNIILSFNVTKV